MGPMLLGSNLSYIGEINLACKWDIRDDDDNDDGK